MLSNTQTDKFLDDCFNGTITREQLAEMLLISSKEVTNDLIKEHLVAITAVQQYNLLMQVKQVHSLYIQPEAKEKEKAVVRPLFTLKLVMRIAAVLLLILSSWLFYEYSTNSYNRLYADMFATYTVNEVRSTDAGQMNKLVEAYRAGEYSKTTDLFTTVLNPTSRELFFTAMSYLEIGKPSDAVLLFDKIYSYNEVNGEKLYEDEADYYLALTWLRLNEKQKAVKLFEKIKADKEHTYSKHIKPFTIQKIKWFAHK
jgi:tetratricopeptide (TPR) repeat protein